MAGDIPITLMGPVSSSAPGEEPKPAPDHDSATDSLRNHPTEFDEATERRYIRKIDRRLVVLGFFCYMAAFLDRSNIGNAETAGMSEDLGFTNEQYQWLLTIFYIPYILFEWLVLMYKIIPPHIWVAFMVFTWGLASMLQAAAFNWEGLMACRFFLAVAEAGFGPGIPYLYSFYYNRRELGARCGIFLSAAPLATTFAGALAYGITGGQYRIASWRLLFIIEAIPPLVLSVIVWFALPDSAESARFLTEDEKTLARYRALRATGQAETGTSQGNRLGHIDPRDLIAALRTPQAWVQALMYFSCNVAFSSLPVFLPAILTGMGFTSINAQGLTAPPYFLAFGICILTTWLGDRFQQRGLLITGLSLIGCVGYILLAACRPVSVRYVGVFLAAAGVFPAIANILSWCLNNQRSTTQRGAVVMLMNVIGQCGPLLGTRVFPTKEGPYYVKGMGICAGFMGFNALLAFGLRTYFKRRNDAWDRQGNGAGLGGEAKDGEVISASEKVNRIGGDGRGSAVAEDGEVGWENSTAWRYAL